MKRWYLPMSWSTYETRRRETVKFLKVMSVTEAAHLLSSRACLLRGEIIIHKEKNKIVKILSTVCRRTFCVHLFIYYTNYSFLEIGEITFHHFTFFFGENYFTPTKRAKMTKSNESNRKRLLLSNQ